MILMKNFKLLLLAAICPLLQSCFEDAPVTIENNATGDHTELIAPKDAYNFKCFSDYEKDVILQNMKLFTQQQLQNRRDSMLSAWGELMQQKLNIPLDTLSAIYSPETVRQFNYLAKHTDGEVKVVANASLVTSTIVDIIEKHAEQNTDIMLVIDKTGSMADDIQNIKDGVQQLFKALKLYDGVRVAVACYGDKNSDGRNWFTFKAFDTDFAAAFNYIYKLKTSGGGDFPESVIDGVYESFTQGFWQSNSKRMVLLLGDAPSHEGARSNHSLSEIVQISTEQKVKMNFYPIVISTASPTSLVDDDIKPKKLSLIDAVYPNPTKGPLNIQFATDGNYVVEIYNQSGALVHNSNTNGSFYNFNLPSLTDGLYIVKVIDEKRNYDIKKIIFSTAY